MSIFKLDTEAVTSAASSISSLTSEFDSLASTVEGFDVTCEDDFDFAGAKSVIAGNLSACASKVKNTAKLMEKVVNSHSSLQGSMKFETSAEKAATANASNSSSSGTYSSSGVSYSSSGGSYSSSSSSVSGAASTVISGESFSSDSGISSSITSGASISGYLTDSESMEIAARYGLAALPEGAYETETGLVIPGYNYKLQKEPLDPESVVGLPSLGIMAVANLSGDLVNKWYYGHNVDNWHFFSGIHNVRCVTLADSNLSSELKEVATFDDAGYVLYDDRYVISCDRYFGEVGDKVQVITEDGVLECIIGTTSKNLDTNLTFYTNESCDGSYIKENVSTLNLKSINNLEYLEGGSKYNTVESYPDYTTVSYDNSNTMTVLDENGGISYGILESDRNNIDYVGTDSIVNEINGKYEECMNNINSLDSASSNNSLQNSDDSLSMEGDM